LAVRCTVQKSHPSSNLGSKVKGRGHQEQKKTKKCGIVSGARSLGALRAVYVWETSSASSAPVRKYNQRTLSSLCRGVFLLHRGLCVRLCVDAALSWSFALLFGPCWCFYHAVRTHADYIDDDELRRELSRDFCCPCYYHG